MTEPKQPEDPPATEKTHENGNNGVPKGAGAESKGMPTSDREQTETAADPDKHK